MRTLGAILAAVLLTETAQGQTCNRLELAAVQDCVRLSEDSAEPGSSVATFHWENRCSREIQVRYVTGVGELSAMLAPLQRMSVPCEGCGRVRTWTAEC